MDFNQLRLAKASSDRLAELAELHKRINASDVEIDMTGNLEAIDDATWTRATEAARLELLAGVEREFEGQRKALEESGVKNVPQLADLQKEKRK